MAIYQFRCDVCGEKTEVGMSMSDVLAHLDSEVKCDKCGNVMRRVFSAPGIQWNTTGATVRTGNIK